MVDFSGSIATTDIDANLFDSTATTVIAFSTQDNTIAPFRKTETINRSFTLADMGKTYYIGIQAWNVASLTAYRIKRCAGNQVAC